MIKFRFNTNNTIFIIIIIILIILFLRVYNNYEGFFSELGIIKQHDSKRQETSYWTNLVQNLLNKNKTDRIYIYNPINNTSAPYSQKGYISFGLYKGEPTDADHINTILFNASDNNSFTKDLNFENINYNTLDKFELIGSIGDSDYEKNNSILYKNFLETYDYDINLSNEIIDTKKLIVIDHYIIINKKTKKSEKMIIYNNLYEYFYNSNHSEESSSITDSELTDKLFNFNSDYQGYSDLQIKNAVKYLLRKSLHISGNNVEYSKTDYNNKINLATLWYNINKLHKNIPYTFDKIVNKEPIRQRIQSNLSSLFHNIKLTLKLKNPITRPASGDTSVFDNYKTKYSRFYNGNTYNNGIVETITTPVHTSAISKLINREQGEIFIDKIELPIGVKFKLYPAAGSNNHLELYIPYSYLKNKIIGLDNNTPNVNQIEKLYSHNINDNLRNAINIFNCELKFIEGKWIFIIQDINYESYGNLIDNIVYQLPYDTYNIVIREMLNHILIKLRGFKNFLNKIKDILKIIYNKYFILYTRFLEGDIPLEKINFYKPKAEAVPETHIVIGHLALKDLDSGTTINDQLGINYKTIPKHCYVKIRDWQPTDKIYEITANGKKLSFYKNEYTNTILVQNNDKFPDGFVGKIIPCPDKDLKYLRLKNDNMLAKKKCNKLSKIKKNNKLSQDFSDDIISNIMEKRIYDQSLNILDLQEYANKLNEDNIKGKIINQEYNKGRLQNYLTEQKEDIITGLDKLQKGRNRYDVNVNIPQHIVDDIINIDPIQPQPFNCPGDPRCPPCESEVPGECDFICPDDPRCPTPGPDPTNPDVANILKHCPTYDMSGYYKRDPPCMGCKIPADQT